MSNRTKGPRLYFRSARHDAVGKLTHDGTWHIRDGASERGTGFGLEQVKEAEGCLAAYLVEKHTKTVSIGSRDPSAILIDDVLTKYALDIGTKHARPHETASRIGFLRAFFCQRPLSDMSGDLCREYAEQRSSDAAARRELEDLRSAINHHRREGLHDKIVSVVLPPKRGAREHWFEREQAAIIIREAWRYREVQHDMETDKRPRRHVAHFMVFARYMGSRASVICAASIESKRPPDRPWCDLRHGVFYGLPEGARESKKRRQRVRIPAPLLAHLRRWAALGHHYVVEWHGAPVLSVKRGHAASVAAAGLPQDYTPHTWRHTVATWLMQGGADPWKSAGFLGMTVETLIRTYGHHRPDDAAAVHRAL